MVIPSEVIVTCIFHLLLSMKFKFRLVLAFALAGITCISLSSQALASYEADYGSHHAYPVHTHGQGPPGGGGTHGWGQQAGSYYHYHVPLVGQQQSHHHAPQHYSSHDNHLLWILLPLLLLLALPLLLLPLLPLLLIPLGLSLLALLLPLLMMMMMMSAGMMMMMMSGSPMMMMMSPMMKRSLETGDGGFVMRTIGEILLGDVNSLVTRYSRSVDLGRCPERISCEIGSAMFPINASRTSTTRTFMNYVIEQAVPAGRTQETLRQCRDALFEGSKLNNCENFHCQPKFMLYDGPLHHEFSSKSQHSSIGVNGASVPSSAGSFYHRTGARMPTKIKPLKRKAKTEKSQRRPGEIWSSIGSTGNGTNVDEYYKQQYLVQQERYISTSTSTAGTSGIMDKMSNSNKSANATNDQIASGPKTDRTLGLSHQPKMNQFQYETPYSGNYYYYDPQPQENNQLRSSFSKGQGTNLFTKLVGTPVVRV